MKARLIRGFPGYILKTNGEVWSYKANTPKKLSTYLDEEGYVRIHLFKNSKMYKFRLHRLMLTTFISPCPEGYEACHHPDPTRTNNNLSNLRWGTKSTNQKDQIQVTSGKTRRLSIETVSLVKLAIENGLTTKEIVHRYNIKPHQVRSIRSGQTWRWITSSGERV